MGPLCDRIENSDRTGTGPDLDHFLAPEPDYKPEKFNRIQPDWLERTDWPDFYRILKTLTLNLQVTNINMAASYYKALAL